MLGAIVLNSAIIMSHRTSYNYDTCIKIYHKKTDLSYYHVNNLKLCNDKNLYNKLCIKIITDKVDNFIDVKYEKLYLQDYVKLCELAIIKKPELFKYINFEHIKENSKESDNNLITIYKLFLNNDNDTVPLLKQDAIIKSLSLSQRKIIDNLIIDK